MSVSDSLAGDRGGWAVNQCLQVSIIPTWIILSRTQTHPVVIDDLGDDGELPCGRPIVDEDDSADFDESLEGGWLLGLEG